MDRKALEFILKEDILKDTNMLDERFVLAVKHVGTKKEVYKVRFVMQVHADAKKNMLIRSSSNIKQHIIWLLIALAAIFVFKICTQDVLQVCLQIASVLKRELYAQLKVGFTFKPDEVFHLLKQL